MIKISQQAEAAIWERWANQARVDDIEPIKSLYDIEICNLDLPGIATRLVLKSKPQEPTTTEPKEAVQLLQPKDKPVKRAENAGRAKRKVWVKDPNGKVCEYESLTEACNRYGFSVNCVQKYVGGKPYKFHTFSYEKIENPKELVTLNSLVGKDIMVQPSRQIED